MEYLIAEKKQIDQSNYNGKYSIRKITEQINDLENKILYHRDNCIWECSFEIRKNEFKKHSIFCDYIVDYIMDFDKPITYTCLKNHQYSINDIERIIEFKSESIRDIQEDYEDRVKNYLCNLCIFIKRYGDKSLSNEFKIVEQTI